MSLEQDDLDIPLETGAELPNDSGAESESGSASESDSERELEEPIIMGRSQNGLNNIRVPIFKVFNMSKKNVVDLILVFYGFHLDARSEEDLNELFLSNPDDDAFDFFTQTEKLMYLSHHPLCHPLLRPLLLHHYCPFQISSLALALKGGERSLH